MFLNSSPIPPDGFHLATSQHLFQFGQPIHQCRFKPSGGCPVPEAFGVNSIGVSGKKCHDVIIPQGHEFGNKQALQREYREGDVQVGDRLSLAPLADPLGRFGKSTSHPPMA